MTSKVIDLELELPPTPEGIIESMRTFARGRTEQGSGNYRNIFGRSVPSDPCGLGFWILSWRTRRGNGLNAFARL